MNHAMAASMWKRPTRVGALPSTSVGSRGRSANTTARASIHTASPGPPLAGASATAAARASQNTADVQVMAAARRRVGPTA